MGFNAKETGYTEVEAMVRAMVRGEDEQLRYMFEFVQHNELDRPMRQHDWEGFAKRYNGPAYKENRYDEKLAEAFDRYTSRGTPDLCVRAAQVELMYRGFDPQGIDGVLGNNTRAALRRFQGSVGLPVMGELDAATTAALLPGWGSPEA